MCLSLRDHIKKRRKEEDDDMMPFIFPALYLMSYGIFRARSSLAQHQNHASCILFSEICFVLACQNLFRAVKISSFFAWFLSACLL
jgi:hypothetical protein